MCTCCSQTIASTLNHGAISPASDKAGLRSFLASAVNTFLNVILTLLENKVLDEKLLKHFQKSIFGGYNYIISSFLFLPPNLPIYSSLLFLQIYDLFFINYCYINNIHIYS